MPTRHIGFYSNDIAGDLNARVDKALRAALDVAQKPIADVGQKAIDDVLSASGISQEEADAWAAGVEITRAAANRLKKFGYAAEAVRADMAEFYRMTRGRVSKVKIDSKGDRRANATDIYLARDIRHGVPWTRLHEAYLVARTRPPHRG